MDLLSEPESDLMSRTSEMLGFPKMFAARIAHPGPRQRLQLLFLMLAIFQLLTMGAGLLYSYQLEQSYSSGLNAHTHRNKQRVTIAQLGQFANAASMPTTADFQSGDWKDGQERMHYAAELFFNLNDKLTSEIKESPESDSEVILPIALSLRDNMQAMLDQADQAFAAYSRGDHKQFEAHLDYVDRWYARIFIALRDLQEENLRLEDENLKHQVLVAHQARIRNGVFALIASLVLVAIVLYARRMHRQIQADDNELRDNHAALERKVLERTSELRTEIDERRRIEHLTTEENKLLGMIAQNRPLEKVLDALALMIKEHRPGTGIYVSLLGDFAGMTLTLNLPDELTKYSSDHTPITIAQHEKRTVRCDGMGSRFVSAELREIAEREGIRAWWATPTFSENGSVSGTVSLVFRNNAPGEADTLLLGSAARITELAVEHRRMNDALVSQAQHDALTGLPNRLLCEDRLRQAIARAQRHQHSFAVLCLDLDDFKLVNDTLGHLAGDCLLKQVAQRLTSRVRDSDTLVRMGGDEFLVILEELKDEQVPGRVAKDLLATLSDPLFVEGQKLRVTASVGAAVYPKDGATAELLRRNADHAMYQAKGAGKNKYQIFSHTMSQEIAERRDIEIELERALDARTLELWYQPQFTRRGTLAGLEALLRFHHPRLGTVLPGRFIPIAEEKGLIVQIGEWVLREACRQSMEWQKRGLAPVRIAVNVSAAQFARPDFDQTVAKIIQESGVDPSLIELELTESLVMSNVEKSARQMRALKDFGVRISIDDFGTGHSSLSYLHQLPIDTLKIDRSFVEHITEPSGTSAIVHAIIDLSLKLGLRVVGEGVETGAQLAALHEAGCELVQGFLFCKPVTAASVEELLTSINDFNIGSSCRS
jgi:diguanylate cyclase (GGDEF)-like protein